LNVTARREIIALSGVPAPSIYVWPSSVMAIEKTGEFGRSPIV